VLVTDPLIRFSRLVRLGLSFRRRFEDAKRAVPSPGVAWYPYDCFPNLFYVQKLMRQTGLSLESMAGGGTVLDIGAADGALSFFFESLGFDVESWDHAGTNMNRMEGLRALAGVLNSKITIRDVNLDRGFECHRQYGMCLFLGTLYHLKNPFHALETLAQHCSFCFLSTRIARLSPGRDVSLEDIPVAYLLDPGECNADSTNYWIFSPAGLRRLAERAGWKACASAARGPRKSDPSSEQGDERMFLLLRRA
jgi:tRNA (mo5U34)-methyltransferase